jgi:hypothetical protein
VAQSANNALETSVSELLTAAEEANSAQHDALYTAIAEEAAARHEQITAEAEARESADTNLANADASLQANIDNAVAQASADNEDLEGEMQDALVGALEEAQDNNDAQHDALYTAIDQAADDAQDALDSSITNLGAELSNEIGAVSAELHDRANEIETNAANANAALEGIVNENAENSDLSDESLSDAIQAAVDVQSNDSEHFTGVTNDLQTQIDNLNTNLGDTATTITEGYTAADAGIASMIQGANATLAAAIAAAQAAHDVQIATLQHNTQQQIAAINATLDEQENTDIILNDNLNSQSVADAFLQHQINYGYNVSSAGDAALLALIEQVQNQQDLLLGGPDSATSACNGTTYSATAENPTAGLCLLAGDRHGSVHGVCDPEHSDGGWCSFRCTNGEWLGENACVGA